MKATFAFTGSLLLCALVDGSTLAATLTKQEPGISDLCAAQNLSGLRTVPDMSRMDEQAKYEYLQKFNTIEECLPRRIACGHFKNVKAEGEAIASNGSLRIEALATLSRTDPNLSESERNELAAIFSSNVNNEEDIEAIRAKSNTMRERASRYAVKFAKYKKDVVVYGREYAKNASELMSSFRCDIDTPQAPRTKVQVVRFTRKADGGLLMNVKQGDIAHLGLPPMKMSYLVTPTADKYISVGEEITAILDRLSDGTFVAKCIVGLNGSADYLNNRHPVLFKDDKYLCD